MVVCVGYAASYQHDVAREIMAIRFARSHAVTDTTLIGFGTIIVAIAHYLQLPLLKLVEMVAEEPQLLTTISDILKTTE